MSDAEGVLDAAGQWLQGYMAGKDGKAREDRLLEEGAKVGHTAAALRNAKVRLGINSEELSRGTKWSRWWWLPSATYSTADARAAGITRDNWPYGPNIDLSSRVRMVAWAKERGLKAARLSAPLCLKWLEKGTCRGCGTRSGHDEFRIDHVSGWTLDGTPAVIVNHPYDLGDDDIKRLAAVSDNPALSVSSPGSGWYGAWTIQVDVWNSAVRDALWKRREATKREAPALPEEETT